MSEQVSSRAISGGFIRVSVAIASGISGMILGRFGGWLILRLLIVAFSASARPTAWASVERMVTMWREYGWSLTSGTAVGIALALTYAVSARLRIALAIGTGVLWAYSPMVVKALAGHYRLDGFDLLDLVFVILGASLAVRIERTWLTRLAEARRTPVRAAR